MVATLETATRIAIVVKINAQQHITPMTLDGFIPSHAEP